MTTTTKEKGQRAMSDEHKAALAAGREQGRVVRTYLQAINSHRPKRGRKRTPESIQSRLEAIEQKMTTADPLSRLQLAQERLDLQNDLQRLAEPTEDLEGLEAEFVKVAAEYSARKGITYTAWREAGVDASVLKTAGVTRSA